MSDRNKEYYEFLKAWNRKKGTVFAQRQETPHPGRYLSQKRMSAKKRKARQRKMVITAVFFAVLILIIVLICKGCAGGNYDNADLSGVWHYDQYTEYEFDGEGKGCMCLDGNNHFEFAYIAEDGTLHLDFVLDYVTDCQYTYTIDGDKMTLVGGEGTVGGTYTLIRVD